ncbi:MAG TPA: MotA/TolQ/ExbB proton channel family protein [Bacillota bacterium]|nr:MotA/TolQ/ExbB proton channel family protein [Bacillota bacterium]
MKWIVQGGIFMIPLLLCSVVVVAIVGERMVVFSRAMKTALIRYDQPDDVVKQLRQHLAALQTIITIAPMLGLLGTVTGLMKSFYLLGHKVSTYNPQEISTGISEALITTAAGLIIAVIATVFYNYFRARLEEYVHDYNAELNQM